MKVGDKVMSFDFNGIDSCYMVGEVVGIQRDGLFRAKFIKRIWEHEEDTKFKTDYFTAPMQGQMFGDNKTFPRVVVVG
jgi:hypothetical protein